MNKFISSVVLLLCLTGAQASSLNDAGLKPNHWMDQNYNLMTNNYNGLNPAQFFAKDQDPKHGRDAAQGRGALLKIGGGDAGFDFTRICGNGDAEGIGTCPSGLTANDIGTGSTQWACTRDNVTGRTWELKTDDGGLQDVDWGYSWYSTDASSNGGDAGAQTTTSNFPVGCGGHLANCNTEEYAAALSALNGGTGLCGYMDWRLPFPDETTSIIHYGAERANTNTPFVDLDYFPHIHSIQDLSYYWSATPVAEDPTKAWTVPFHLRFMHQGPKGGEFFVMLVRGQYPNESVTSSGSPSTAGTGDCANENTAIQPVTPTSDFTLNADGTATHHKTGLMWDRSALTCCQWAWTLNRIHDVLNPNMHKGYNDWRMPNIKELMSIVEYRCWGPAFNTTVFPDVGQSGQFALWSTTIITGDGGNGGVPRAVQISNGFRTGQESIDSLFATLLVRGGRPLDSFDDQFPTWLLRVTTAGSGSGTVFDTQGNCTGIEDEENRGDCLVAPGVDVSLQALADPGSAFAGWSEAFGSVPTDCNSTIEDCAVSAIAASGSVTATFQLLEYTVSFDSQGGSAVGSITQEYNSSVSLPVAPVRVGYTFQNWNTASDGSGTAYAPASSFTMPASDTTLFAIWAINQYSLDYSAAANGSVTGSLSQTVEHGASGTSVMAVPDADYHFVDWSDGNTDNPRTDSNVTADIAVNANFAVNAADLQISKSNGQTEVIPNQVLVYEILLANAGPYAVDGATFTDNVPDGLSNVLWSCETAGGGATCPNPNGSGNTINQTVDLPVNGVLRYLVTGTVNASPGASIDNTATLSIRAPLAEIDTSNNSAQDHDPVVSLGIDIFIDGFENSAKAISVPITAER